MWTSDEKISLANVRGGAVIEAFDEELAQVLDNINDPNTNPSAARELTLKLKIKPDDDRTISDIEFTVWPNKLAPRRIITGRMVIGGRCGRDIRGSRTYFGPNAPVWGGTAKGIIR